MSGAWYGAGWFGRWFGGAWYGVGGGALVTPAEIPAPARLGPEVEVWTTFEAAGGVPLSAGRYITKYVVKLEEERSVAGEEWLDLAAMRDSVARTALQRGRVVRVTPDGGTPVEWEVDRVTVQSGPDDVLLVARCVGVRRRLTSVPVTYEDGDGFVYRSVPVVQRTPATILSNVLLAAAPAWITAGTTTPTDLEEVQFDGDNALSGAVKLADLTGYEVEFERNGGTAHNLHIRTIGASAPAWRIRTGRNLRSLRKEAGSGDQVTRMTGVGPDGDDGPSTLAWAYWKVTNIASNNVTLASIHGGPGPILYDDQLNHANLGGTLYLENAQTGSRSAISDSVASTQVVAIASASGYTVGDWVRVVASSGGRHHLTIDAPAEIATEGGRTRPGEFQSAWDDTVNILLNPLGADMPSPTARPTNWGGSGGTIAKITTATQFLTGGHSVQISGSFSPGASLFTMTRSWVVSARRATWSATAWIRVTSSTGAGLGVGFRITRNGSPIGEALEFITPHNVWRQLKIEGIAMPTGSATLGVEFYMVGSGFLALQVDSVQLSPTYTARPILWGSGPARTWQQAARSLDERRGEPVTWQITAADLARAGYADETPLALGAWGTVVDEDLGETVPARLVRLRRDLLREVDTSVTLSTEPRRLRDRFVSPRPLVVPFFEPIHVQVADRDTRNAALFISATVTAVTDTQVTVSVTATDSLGGTPTVTLAVFGATLDSGTYIFNRPATGAGVGRAIFTATLPGRSPVTDAVDIPEVEGTPCVMEVRPTTVSATQVVVNVYVAAPRGAATATIGYTALGASVSPASGQNLSATTDLGTTNYVAFTITRAAFGSTPGVVAFTATVPGHLPTTQTIDVESVSDLASTTKIVNIELSAFKEVGEYLSEIDEDTGGPAMQSAAGTAQITEHRRFSLEMIPEGATITQVKVDLWGYGPISGNSTAMLWLMKGNSLTVVGSRMDGSAGGSWSNITQNLSETVAANTRYFFKLTFFGDSTGGSGSTPADRRIRNLSISYTSPNLQVTR